MTGYVEGFPWQLMGMRTLAPLLALFFATGPLSA